LSRNGSLDDKQAFPPTEADTADIPYEIWTRDVSECSISARDLRSSVTVPSAR
jgi:hypothetical protein